MKEGNGKYHECYLEYQKSRGVDFAEEVERFMAKFADLLELAREADNLHADLAAAQDLMHALQWFSPGGSAGAAELNVSWFCTLCAALHGRIQAALVYDRYSSHLNRAVHYVWVAVSYARAEVERRYQDWKKEEGE